MSVRAVVFDIYTTILEVGPPPPNADVLWGGLFMEMLGEPPPLGRTDFAVRTAQIIARHHHQARAQGIQWPEILWPLVVLEAIPSVARLPAPELADFLFRQMEIGRSLRLAQGADECLRYLNAKGTLLGIASNSQAYTLRELEVALQGAGLNLSIFDPDVRFMSFENGFSKPDPHVFRALTARIEARGISPGETLMVGDRLDNDIKPARAFGWKTWLLSTKLPIGCGNGGSWGELHAWLG